MHVRVYTYLSIPISLFLVVALPLFGNSTALVWTQAWIGAARLHVCVYPPTPAGAAPRSSVHVCSPLSTTRPLPFLQIAIGPRLPHPFYCSGISPPSPGTRRSHSAVLGTKPSSAARPFPFEWYFNGSRATRHSSALLGTPRHSSALLGTTNCPRLLHPVYFSGIAMVVE